MNSNVKPIEDISDAELEAELEELPVEELAALAQKADDEALTGAARTTSPYIDIGKYKNIQESRVLPIAKKVYSTRTAMISPAANLIRGDVNNDGKLDMSDAIDLLNYLSQDGEKPACSNTVDFDEDGFIKINDAISLLNYLEKGSEIRKNIVPMECGADLPVIKPKLAFKVAIPLNEEEFVRGDPNGDGMITIADPIFILKYMFASGEKPQCLDAADVNDDGIITIADGIYLLNLLFANGPSPPLPYPNPGIDPTLDKLECGI
ncbi:MAG: hypothetical protein KJ580_03665 [Nanoarchaeota archaeon]|nr:hypothetical protein [Nanoarchaeota archaeon]